MRARVASVDRDHTTVMKATSSEHSQATVAPTSSGQRKTPRRLTPKTRSKSFTSSPARGKRSALGDLHVDLRHVGAALGPDVLLRLLGVLMHAIRTRGYSDTGRHAACPLVEELSLAVGQCLKRGHRVGPEPPERQDVVGADRHVHRVDLRSRERDGGHGYPTKSR